eukprot:2193620-Rhodomonas_salina.2
MSHLSSLISHFNGQRSTVMMPWSTVKPGTQWRVFDCGQDTLVLAASTCSASCTLTQISRPPWSESRDQHTPTSACAPRRVVDIKQT